MLWAAKKLNAIDQIVDGAAGVVKNTAEPANTAIGSWRQGWDSSAREKEQELKQEGKAGVITGTVGSLLFVGVAVLLGLLNFGLILRPMQDIMPNVDVYGLPLSVVATVALLAGEFLAGAFLFWAAGWSQLIPVRKGKPTIPALIIIGLIAMILLALLEAGLAVYREVLMESERGSRADAPTHAAPPLSETPADLPGAMGALQVTIGQAPAWAQAALGFMVPWLLILVVLPVEFLLLVLPILFFRVISILAIIPQGLAVLLNVLTQGLNQIIKGAVVIVTIPAEIVYIGLRPILRHFAPEIFRE